MFNRHFLNAKNIFEITTVPPLPGMPLLANLRATKKKQIAKNLSQGCGLYFILHKSKLVYIGKFLGTKSDAFCGDIFSARWCRHISTLPARGARISVGVNLVNRLHAEQPLNRLTTTLKSASSSTLASDRGFMVPFNRLKFAALNWSSFRDPSNVWINDFQFGYVQLVQATWSSHTTPQIRTIINKAESKAIDTFKPVCNVESTFHEDLIKEYDIETLFGELEAALSPAKSDSESLLETEVDDDSESHRDSSNLQMETDLMSSGYGENFLESIPEDCPQETVDSIYSAFGADPNVQIHHTRTAGGDLRVRALNTQKPRNVFTMYWQTRKDTFFCRIHLPLANVTGPGIVDAKNSSLKEPLRTSFSFDCSQPGSIPNLINLIRQAHAAA